MCIQERKTAGFADDDFNGVPVFQVMRKKANAFSFFFILLLDPLCFWVLFINSLTSFASVKELDSAK